MSTTECCSCSCGCGCCTSPPKQVRVDFLYLGLNTCDRCNGTEKALDEAVLDVRPALSAAGYDVTVQNAGRYARCGNRVGSAKLPYDRA